MTLFALILLILFGLVILIGIILALIAGIRRGAALDWPPGQAERLWSLCGAGWLQSHAGRLRKVNARIKAIS